METTITDLVWSVVLFSFHWIHYEYPGATSLFVLDLAEPHILSDGHMWYKVRVRYAWQQ